LIFHKKRIKVIIDPKTKPIDTCLKGAPMGDYLWYLILLIVVATAYYAWKKYKAPGKAK
jgi:hypothetical protein